VFLEKIPGQTRKKCPGIFPFIFNKTQYLKIPGQRGKKCPGIFEV